MGLSLKEIRDICYTPQKRKLPFLRRLFYREPSFLITKLLLYTSITGNQVTFVSLIIGLIVVYLFSLGNYVESVMGGLLLYFFFLFDQIDGNIARIRKEASPLGQYYDRLVHRILEPLIFIALGYGLYKKSGEIYFLLIGILIALSILWIYSFMSEKYRVFWEIKLKRKEEEKKKRKKSLLNLLKKIYDLTGFLFRMPSLIIIILIFVILDYVHILLYFYAIFMPLIALGTFIYETRIRFKDVS